MNRRSFLISFGKLGFAAISGWVVLKPLEKVAQASGLLGRVSAHPKLRDGLQIKPFRNGYQISRVGQNAERICYINDSGYNVLRHVNGKNTVDAISSHILGHRECSAADAAKCSAGVARFVAELGIAGLLEEPFRVQVVQAEYSQKA